jgi:restriction system protein
VAQIDRQARERERGAREREKAQEQERLDTGERTARERTAEVDQRLKNLDEVLTSVLALPPVSFERLTELPDTPRFEPGSLGRKTPEPDWTDFAPVRSSGLRALIDTFGRRRRAVTSARARFTAAQREHERQETERKRELAAAKARHDQQVTRQRAAAVARNSEIRRLGSAFVKGDAEAVAWFVGGVLDASAYPEGFPRAHRVVYHPDSRGVTVEYELPPDSVVPAASGYRYLAERDAVEPLPRPGNEIDERHDRLVAAIALRTLHEVFAATPPDVIRAAEFDGYLTSVDPATGKTTRPRLLRVSADRRTFEDLVLAAVEPVACVGRLKAREIG